MHDKPQKEPLKPRSSGLFKLLLACGCLAATGFVVVGVGLGIVAYVGLRFLNDTAAPYVEKGYRRVTAQIVTERRPVAEPTVYVAQKVTLREGAAGNVALISQIAEVHGTVEGDIDFFGQLLDIKEDAVVKGDVRVNAQVVSVKGVVEGEISGTYGMLDDKRQGREGQADEAGAEKEATDPQVPAEEKGTSDEVVEEESKKG
jgi:hypothetical protein